MLSVGTILQDDDHKNYQITGDLGEGVTSRVYRATVLDTNGVLVALKVLRDGLPTQVRENFWREQQILGGLNGAEANLADGIRVIPRLIGTRLQGTPGFLAIELVEGLPINQALLKGPGYFTEAEVLLIADRLLRVLEILHQQLRRTYTDFQLQNIWVRRDSITNLLMEVKVIDWNHVSNEAVDKASLPSTEVQQDLARLGAYLFRMATGKGASERGEFETQLAKRVDPERWQACSYGLRSLLVQALHPNVSKRFATAPAFRQRVHELQRFWRKDKNDLLEEFVREFEHVRPRPEDQEAFNRPANAIAVERTQTMLDIAARKGITRDKVTHYQKDIDHLTLGKSISFRAGMNYFSVGQYDTALEYWSTEAEEKESLAMTRWVILAKIGRDVGRATFEPAAETLREVISALEAKDFDRAESQLATIPFTSPAMRALNAEIQLHTLWRNAEIAESDTTLERAEATLTKWTTALNLTNADLFFPLHGRLLLQENGWTDLPARVERATARVAQYRAYVEDQQKILVLLQQPENFEQGLTALQSRLEQTPDLPPLIDSVLQVGQTLLEHAPEMAVRLLELLWLFGKTNPTQTAELRTGFRKAQSNLEISLNDKAVRHQIEAHYEHERTQLEAQLQADLEQRRADNHQALQQLQATHDEALRQLQNEYEAKWQQEGLAYQAKLEKLERELEQKQVVKAELAEAEKNFGPLKEDLERLTLLVRERKREADELLQQTQALKKESLRLREEIQKGTRALQKLTVSITPDYMPPPLDANLPILAHLEARLIQFRVNDLTQLGVYFKAEQWRRVIEDRDNSVQLLLSHFEHMVQRDYGLASLKQVQKLWSLLYAVVWNKAEIRKYEAMYDARIALLHNVEPLQYSAIIRDWLAHKYYFKTSPERLELVPMAHLILKQPIDTELRRYIEAFEKSCLEDNQMPVS